MATTITNRGELIAVVKDYLIESALTDSGGTDMLPLFVKLAENEFNKYLNCREMEDRATATTSETDPEFVQLPTSFLRPLLIICKTGTRQRLTPMTPDQLEHAYGDETGTPMNYAIIGSEMRLGPVPNQTTTLEMYYLKKLTPLTADNDTNWLLTGYPELYLYGTLAQAAKYAKNQEEVADWISFTSQTINSINARSAQSKVGSGALKLQIR